MANLTKAERHNRMLNNTFDTYHRIEAAKKDLLPTCSEYGFFLSKAVEKLKITRDEARTNYGQFTYGQWKELLKLF
jgi:hypothetical protein